MPTTRDKGKQQRFVALAEKRVPRAIRELRLVGNLANVHNYAYTPEQAQRIVSTLEQEVKLLKARFSSSLVKKNPTFKL